MAIIILNNLRLTYGERDLFDNISAHFEDGQKIGVVGRNGAGKSTLLKIISGQLKPDEGSITLSRQKRIAFLPQEVVLNSHESVYDEVFTVFNVFLELEREQHEIEEQLAAHADDATQLLERYQVILDALSHFDRGSAEGKAKTILKGLGFSEDNFSTPVNTLSVGWKMRVVLAKLLLQEADFYLFDEPTNHLDMVTKEWFLHFLRNAPFGYLLVTHDRYFLDKGCESIFALSLGKATMYRGNYTRYIKQFNEDQDRLHAAYEQQRKEIARKEDTINRFRASATKAKMAQSMIKQLAKVERIQIDPIEPTFSTTFPPVERSGKTVLTVKDLSYDYGEKLLFKKASCEVQRGHKVALVAMNGMGKSTLFDLIAGRLELQSGSVDFGHNVKFALFEQDQAKALNANKTVFEEV